MNPLLSQLKPTAVNAILAEVRQLQSEGRALISLMRGEPDLPTPAHIVEACNQALAKGRTHYPDNRGEKNFREAVAVKLQRDNHLTYDPATEIIATSGSTFGIYAALEALLEEGGEVLLPDPVYDAYQSPIRLVGAIPKPFSTRIQNGRFAITREDLEGAVSPKTKMLILNTPWNPTGTVLSQAELEMIGDFCQRHSLMLLSDEIYETLLFDGHKHISPVAAMRSLRDRTIVVNSLSKTYAMPGWRVGYCAGPAKTIQAMFMVLAQSSRGPATFIQDAAAEALLGSQQCVADMCEEYTRRRQKVLQGLAGIPGVPVLAPEGGFFAMADVRGIPLPSNEIRRNLMHDHGVVVVHGGAYGPGGEGTLRISFASGGENLDRGLVALRSGLIALSR